MANTVGAKREIRKLVEHLWEHETVDRMTAGFYGNGTGLIVLTDRRMFFLKDGWMSQKSEDFPLERISSIQWSSGVLLGTITVFASGNKAEIKNVNKVDGKEIVDLIRARLSGQAGPPQAGYGPPSGPPPARHRQPPPGPPPTSDPDVVFHQLRQLGELRDAGVVTPTEFEAKKAELLSRI
ncbi:PH domain-containing protein [Pseudonocardia petroleophila]|uniref:PH domain-containing protein n=2 Tax=Pseudonocardia petroleophila TaxID=37331 RepID=A0A7G7MR96_9PSEU|nr:PH domain-containing protein [Pseudonocardia petroleophila]